MKFYIVYSKTDTSFATKLRRLLKKSQIQVSLKSIHFFLNKSKLIKTLPNNSNTDIFCFVISKKSFFEDWKLELLPNSNLYTQKVSFLVPLLIEDTAIPHIFYDLEYVDFRTSFSKGFNQLLYIAQVKEALDNELET